MTDLETTIQENSIELLIWDFDGVLFKMEWNHNGTVIELLEEFYNEITKIDESIISDKTEFISRLFPYPEINQVGIKHGKEAQDRVKSVFERKEFAARDLAKPNHEILNYIKNCPLPQSIWSNNLSGTIEYLLKKQQIEDKIDHLSTLDMVIQSKPHTEGFKIINENYPNIAKKNILFIGDSLRSDKVAAENTGIKFFHYQ